MGLDWPSSIYLLENVTHIFNKNLDQEKFTHFNFLPITDDESIGAMGEKWEMVISQKNRISVWRFAGEKTSWWCLDLHVGDRFDSFDMEQFEGVQWKHTQTFWLRTLDEVIDFVGVVATLDIDPDM